MTEAALDAMEVVEDVAVEGAKHAGQEFEVLKITSRKESPDGLEHLYEVYWKDGDITFEPVSNLSGASDALRAFLEENHPNDTLLKVLSSLGESDAEDNNENGGDMANDVEGDKKMSWLARWHQKTTRGSTQYWLRKGDDRATIPSLLKKDVIDEITETPQNAAPLAPQNAAPLAPSHVPDTRAASPDVSAVLFSEGEETPGTSPGLRIRRRIRVMEETVKMFPHEELYDAGLEQQQNKTLALWKEILTSILLIVPIAVFVFLYCAKQPTSESAPQST